MKPLAEIQAGDLLSSGLFPGLDGVAGPLWRDGLNVSFDNGGVRKSYGLLGLETLSARPTGVKSTLADGEPRAYVGVGDTAYKYDQSSGMTAIGTFSAPAGVFQFVDWDTYALISNGVDPVEVWPNAGMSAPITAPFGRANTIFKYHIRAFAGGTDNGGNIVEWSNQNNITADWTPTALNTSGNLTLRELAGDIVAAVPIGNSIGIYGSVNAGLFYFAGGAPVYAFRKPIRGVSAIGPYSVIGMGDRHYGLTLDNAFVTDLVSYQLIDEPAMRRWLLENMDPSRAAEIYGWPDWANNVARWAIPLRAGGTQSIGFRIDKGTWTRFNDGVVCGEESGPFMDTLLLKQDRLLIQSKLLANNDGQAFPSYVQSKPLDLGERNQFKRMQKLSFDGTWSGDVRVSLGHSEHPNAPPTWDYDSALADEIFPDGYLTRSEFALLHVKIYSDEKNASWNISGAKFYGEYTGFIS